MILLCLCNDTSALFKESTHLTYKAFDEKLTFRTCTWHVHPYRWKIFVVRWWIFGLLTAEKFNEGSTNIFRKSIPGHEFFDVVDLFVKKVLSTPYFSKPGERETLSMQFAVSVGCMKWSGCTVLCGCLCSRYLWNSSWSGGPENGQHCLEKYQR